MGVTAEEFLTWYEHIEILTKKLSSGVRALKRTRPFCNYKDILIFIYGPLIQCHLDHCCEVWGNFRKTLSEKIQKFQNKAARMILYDDNR